MVKILSRSSKLHAYGGRLCQQRRDFAYPGPCIVLPDIHQGFDIPFVVVEYNQSIISELKDSGIPALYGDPTEPEVLEAVGVRNSKAVILAIPDRVAQETLIAYVQTVSPGTKIISRAHQEADWEKLKDLQVDKVVQPEFEAALAIVRSVFSSMGKTKEEISAVTKSLRLSRSR